MKRRVEPRKVLQGLRFRFGPSDMDERPGFDADPPSYGAIVGSLVEMKEMFGRGTRRFVNDRRQTLVVELGEARQPAALEGGSLVLRLDAEGLDEFCACCRRESQKRSWGDSRNSLDLWFGCEFDLPSIMAAAEAALTPGERRKQQHQSSRLRKAIKRNKR